jgi:tetratricopeptide (TPR) repeat protein
VFARALGAARSGQSARAQEESATLQSFREALVATQQHAWAEQVEIQRRVAAAWVARAAGEHEAALQIMRSASALEASCQSPSIMLGLLAPAHEHLGELLLERGEPGQALHTFETWLHAEPNRLNALYGAAQASEIMGDLAKAHAFYTTLVELRTSAGRERIEFAQAIAFLANFNIER